MHHVAHNIIEIGWDGYIAKMRLITSNLKPLRMLSHK